MSRTAAFRQLVRDCVGGRTVLLPPGTSCAEAVRRMRDERADSVVVVAADGTIAGIVTEQDVTRRVAFRAAGDTPVERVMTSPVRTIREDDHLYRAIAIMRRAGLRHMPAVDGDGRVTGVIDLHQALATSSSQLVGLIDRLTREDSVAGLAEVKSAQVEVADALFDDGVPATEIQALLSDINLDLHRRVVDLALADMARDGWGQPPVAFCLIVMGSGGRRESFLYPDQDNGLVLADHPDAAHNRIDAWFIELAERMTETLAEVGIRLCRGNVMATNPVWRKSLGQWRDQFDIWMRRRSNVAVRLSDIFFDFRPACGDADLAAALRRHVTAAVARAPAFLRAMYDLEADHKVALGLFGRLITEGPDETIDLKYHGTLPLVEGVRLYALRAGVADTSTLDRIAALHAKGVLDDDEQDYLAGAFHLITRLLLRQQVADYRAGARVTNLVPVAALSERERDMLVDCFKAISASRDRIRHELTGDIF